MKKIGIVTIESFNLGNRLQNYALQEILKNMGFQVETIRRSSEEENILKRIMQEVLQTKRAKFRAFDKLINKSKWFATKDEAPKEMCNEYDYFIAGSDQVWNPYYDFVGKTNFLEFAKHEQKIAYAASFGVSELPEEAKKRYKDWLDDFKNIAVRENAGADIIEDLINKDVSVVLDPTLMLNAENWRSLEKKPKNVPKTKYILVYSVEGMSENMKEVIEEKKKTYEVVDIRQKLKNGHEWAVGPAEFLYLVDHASELYTDSFHGTVFSILFHTKFRIFERDGINMNSRIETLLEKTGLKEEQKVR